MTDHLGVLGDYSSSHSAAFDVVAIGTGTKCLGAPNVCSEGFSVNDCHAEVLARRAFVRFLTEQIQAENKKIVVHENGKYRFKSEDFQLFLVCTHTPCGDMSIIDKEKQNGASFDDSDNSNSSNSLNAKRLKLDIHRTGAKCTPNAAMQDLKESGSNYHIPGAFRTKPGRGHPSLSMSCSDKLTKWCVMGVQGGMLAQMLDSPIYIDSIIITECPFSVGVFNRTIDRNQNFNPSSVLYSVKMPEINQVLTKFCLARNSQRICPTPVSSFWFLSQRKVQFLVDGYPQGLTRKNRNKTSTMSPICRKSMSKLFLTLAQNNDWNGREYSDCKEEHYIREWNQLKSHYADWIPDTPKRSFKSFKLS